MKRVLWPWRECRLCRHMTRRSRLHHETCISCWDGIRELFEDIGWHATVPKGDQWPGEMTL